MLQMTDSFENFRSQIIKLKEKKKHTITNSNDLRDIYRWLKEHKLLKNNISEKQFSTIINRLNLFLVEEFIKGKDIKFPQSLGKVSISIYKTKVSFKDGKLKVNRPIDWSSTLKLWYVNKNAFTNKTLVKQDSEFGYKIYYNKKNIRQCKNLRFYDFYPSRYLKSKIKEAILNGYFSHC
jgi:hypothetical protein